MAAFSSTAFSTAAFSVNAFDFGPVPPSGVRGVRAGRKRELIVSLRDVIDKQSTADFLKAQLRLRHPESSFDDRSAEDAAVRTKLALQMAEEARKTAIHNENMKILIILAASTL